MITPLCGICLNSDILCMACKKKLESGVISESDVRVSRIVNDAAKTFRPLDGIGIKKVMEEGGIIVIVCKKGDGARLVGKGGVMIKKLSKLIGKQVRIVEDTGDIKEFMCNLIQPIPVMGMNIIYRPEGEVLKVIIPRGRKIPLPKGSFAKIVGLMFGKDCIISND